MKNFIKGITMSTLAGLFFMSAQMHVSASCSYFGLTHNDNEVCYSYGDFGKAVQDAQNGDVLKMYSVYYPNQIDSIVRNGTAAKFTIDFNNHSLSKVQIDIEDGSDITFNNLKEITNPVEGPGLIVGNGTLTINGGTINNIYNASMCSNYLIKVGSNTNTGHVILNDNVILNSNCAGILVDGNNSVLDIENAKIDSQQNAIDYTGTNTEINIKGGELYSSAGATICYASGAKSSIINVSGGTLKTSPVYLGNNVTFNMTGGLVDALYDGVSIIGSNSKINLSSGTIKAKWSPIHTYKTANNAEIVIDNGTIEGLGTTALYGYGDLQSPAILLENVKKLTINGGELKGNYGVIALQGEVEINGGVINATPGTGKISTSEGANNLYTLSATGIDVVVDNAKEGYSNNAHATITKGTFNASGDTTLLSVKDDASEYTVSGGIYDKEFNKEFVIPDKLELKITASEDAHWYVGDDAIKGVEEAKADTTNEIEVIKGNLSLSNATTGLKVTNTGNGQVTVNGRSVSTGQTLTAEPAKSSSSSSGNNNNNNNKPSDNDNTNTDNNTNEEQPPKTIDYINLFVFLFVAGATTVLLILLTKLKRN